MAVEEIKSTVSEQCSDHPPEVELEPKHGDQQEPVWIQEHFTWGEHPMTPALSSRLLSWVEKRNSVSKWKPALDQRR